VSADRSRATPLQAIVAGGIVLLLLALPLSDGGRTSLARAILTAGVFSLLSLLLISRDGPAFLRRVPIRWLGLAALFLGVSCYVSIHPDFSIKEALMLLSVAGGSLVAAYVACRGMRYILVLATVASGVIAVVAAVPAYLTAPPDSQAAAALSGAFHYPNGLGSFLLLVVFLPLASLLHGGTRIWGVGSAIVAGVLFAALILTHSRGVLASALIALAFWTILERRLIRAGWARLALAVMLAVTLVIVASRRPGDIAPRVVSLTAAASRESPDPSFRWRWDIYAWTLQILKDHPWAGTGIGTFPIAIKGYQRLPYVTGLYAHSQYLQTGAEMGAPGLLALIGLVGFLVWRGAKIIAALEQRSVERSLAAALAVGLFASALHAAVDFGWSYPAIALVAGVEVALLLTLAPHPAVSAKDPYPERAGIPLARPLVLACCLALAVLAGARYYAEVFRNRGRIALDAGQPERAVRAFQWAIRLNPVFYSPRQLLASAYAAQGDSNNAHRAVEAALRLDRFDGDAHHEAGKVYWRLGEAARAEAAFLSAVRLQPYTRPILYYDLAELYLVSGREQDALTWLSRGSDVFTPEVVTTELNRCLAPGDRYVLARMYWRMGQIRDGQGHHPEAEEARRQATRLAKPAMEEICFRAMQGPFRSPESTIVTHWEARRQQDWSTVMSSLSRGVDSRLREESLAAMPAQIEVVEVDWVVSLVGNEQTARVGYEVKVGSSDGRFRKSTFTDTLTVEGGGWRLRRRQMGLQ
jgi:O-antigen ligase